VNLYRIATLLTAAGLVMVARPPAAMEGSSSFRQGSRQEQSLESVMQRAMAYVASFERDFSAVVAEEQFEQRASSRGPDTVRRTRSDLLLVRVPGREAWLPFRDVFELNGRAVRDRNERLQKLFVDAPASALADAARMTSESSRYNLGSVIRTINVPTFGLMLLRPGYVKRLQFRKHSDELIGEVMAWRVEFIERGRPTVVRTLRDNDVPLEGSFWIDPLSGRVVKTLVKSIGTPDPGRPLPPPSGDILMWVVVTYAPSETLRLWVPQTMSEWARAANLAIVSGTATYVNFRRFEVSATETFTTDRQPER
jgi:hypothetical protein